MWTHLYPVSAGSVVSVICAAKYESRPRRYAGPQPALAGAAGAAWEGYWRIFAFRLRLAAAGAQGSRGRIETRPTVSCPRQRGPAPDCGLQTFLLSVL